MMEIDAARGSRYSPLDMLVVDYFMILPREPSIDFCRRAAGVPDADEVVARRLHVSISTVRGWREIGRRAQKWTSR